jgi:hypothetical protein
MGHGIGVGPPAPRLDDDESEHRGYRPLLQCTTASSWSDRAAAQGLVVPEGPPPGTLVRGFRLRGERAGATRIPQEEWREMNDIERILAAEAERVESAESNREYVTPAPPTGGSQVYTVRIPVDSLEALRHLAQRRGTPPSAMMRAWVLERLAFETSLQPTTARVTVAGRWRREVARLTSGRWSTPRTHDR